MANSTQRFEVPSDDEDEGTDLHQQTQAFTIPETGAFEIDESAINGTQAFDVGDASSTSAATQAFSLAAMNDDENIGGGDPIYMPLGLDDVGQIGATQHFSVGEYAVIGENEAQIDYEAETGNDGQQNDGNPTTLDQSLDKSMEGVEYEMTVAEEVVAGDEDADEVGSDVGPMDEIASPDPEEQEEEQEDDEEQEEEIARPRKNRISSDDEEEEQEGEGAAESPSKRSRLFVDDDEEEEGGGEGGSGARRAIGSDDEEDDDPDADKKSAVGELIANIFGDSDDDAAVSDAEEPKEGHSRKTQHEVSDSETKDSDDGNKLVVAPDFISDFDLMMERKKAENRRRYKKRKDYDIVNDSDDVITELISQMKQAAKTDSDLNKAQKPASSKRKLLPTVVKQLKKSDLQSAFIELGVVTAIADWLCPLPDGSLPALEIRTELLKVLQQFPTLDHQILKSSSIGKAVMILYKHPKEIKENKERAGKLINEWARPIFSLQSDYRSLSKEERLQRDYEHMPVARKRRMDSVDGENKPKTSAEEEERPLRPGDKGWIGRARVPQPSTKDYVVRPKWNIESEVRNTSNKRNVSAMDRKIREIRERTKPKKASRAVGVSIEGRKML